ncbi:hypothetical protein MF271_22485 (plasmid) [Deinococcus sp. KNUC1210]|uniref:hypothetical protein n=1 Tax=Deinococcus sp. KNUC1210 TaxID=2917691 RepID=UPI001EF0369E|nr:hypothetical protein [Deinococcus sp. KNUC1210]ULH18236.1 hypothetical protein MF271_22485 [Deinococcus sp. KNUC1210]
MLALDIFSRLQAKDVRHAELAERFPESDQTSSVIRRIERSFDRPPLCAADIARVVLILLPDKRPRECILDRTNWKYGQQDVNVLLLAVLWQGAAILLLFELLPHGGIGYAWIQGLARQGRGAEAQLHYRNLRQITELTAVAPF